MIAILHEETEIDVDSQMRHPNIASQAALEQQQRREAEQAKARRASQGGTLLFSPDAQSKHAILQESYALAFDYRMASMFNRALFVFTEPILQQGNIQMDEPVAKRSKIDPRDFKGPVHSAAQTTANQVHALVNAPLSQLVPLPPFVSQCPGMANHPALNFTNPSNDRKPDLSIQDLIKEAIMASKDKRLTAAQLFDAIETRHP